MTTEYPVHYTVDRPERFTRLQLLARIIAFMALGVIGLSFGTIFLFAYLALPVFAASRLASSQEPGAYVGRDGPRVLSVLRWFAAVCAWTGLTTEHLPSQSPPETVRLEVEGTAHPTPGSALWRVLAGIPSALLLAVLGCIGSLVWLWAALSVLFSEKVGKGTHEFLVGLQRWSVRLLVYQASLVDAYPPFSFSDTASPILPPARVMS